MEQLAKKGIKQFFKREADVTDLAEEKSYRPDQIFDFISRNMAEDMDQVVGEEDERIDQFQSVIDTICNSDFYDAQYMKAVDRAQNYFMEQQAERRYQKAHAPTGLH